MSSVCPVGALGTHRYKQLPSSAVKLAAPAPVLSPQLCAQFRRAGSLHSPSWVFTPQKSANTTKIRVVFVDEGAKLLNYDVSVYISNHLHTEVSVILYSRRYRETALFFYGDICFFQSSSIRPHHPFSVKSLQLSLGTLPPTEMGHMHQEQPSVIKPWRRRRKVKALTLSSQLQELAQR